MTAAVETPPLPAALPVALDLAGPHAAAVRSWVEGVLGWQAVDADATGWAPPAVRLVDVAGGQPAPSGVVPTVLLVTDEDDPGAVAAAGAAQRPEAVVTWPAHRDRLVEEVAHVLAVPRPHHDRPPVLRVGGAAGGVGTTTVTLALAGLAAWRGARTLAVVRGSVLAGELRSVPAAALGAPGLWERGTGLPGVPDARLVSIGRAELVETEPMPTGVDVVVVDAGVGLDAEVLVCRPDAAGLAGIGETAAAAIVVNGTGSVRPAALVRACAPRRPVVLPWSARVAQAGLHGRVPAGLPGAWLRRLAPVVPRAASGRVPGVAQETST